MKILKLKSILFGLMAVLAISIVMTSCEQEAVNDDFVETNSVIERIVSLGHQQKDIVELDDFYLVEGCIMYPKNLDFYIKKELEARQASTNNLVSQANVTSMTVFIDPSIPTTGVDNWRNGINSAISDMNGISNSKVNFSLVDNADDADIVIRSDAGALDDDIIASAGFPSGNQPFNSVLINFDFLSNRTVSEAGKRYNMVHELGHCIGLRHTNWAGIGETRGTLGANQIAGTPNADPNSVMNGRTALSTWSGFSANDIIAIETLYPADNSLSWNPTPTSISNGNNQVTLDYSIDINGILLVQVYNSSWSLIGQVYENVSPGTRSSTMTLPADNPSANNNHVQAKLLNSSWQEIGVTRLYEKLPRGGTPPPTGGNSLSWNPTPTSISSGNNQVTLDYSIDINGILLVQVFNSSWSLIGQVYENVSPGARQLTLTLPANNPSANNHVQAKLLNSSWQEIGVPRLYEKLPRGGTPPPTGGNSLSWNPTPTSISNGNNPVTVDYSINQSGILLVQVYNSNWELKGQVYENVSAGATRQTLTLPANGLSSSNNHLQAKLLNSSWQDIGVPRLYVKLP